MAQPKKIDGWSWLVRLQRSDTTVTIVKAFFFFSCLETMNGNDWWNREETKKKKKGAVSKHSHKPGGGEDKIDTFISAAAASRRHVLGVCASRNGWGRDTTCYSRCLVNIWVSCRVERDGRGVEEGIWYRRGTSFVCDEREREKETANVISPRHWGRWLARPAQCSGGSWPGWRRPGPPYECWKCVLPSFWFCRWSCPCPEEPSWI